MDTEEQAPPEEWRYYSRKWESRAKTNMLRVADLEVENAELRKRLERMGDKR